LRIILDYLTNGAIAMRFIAVVIIVFILSAVVTEPVYAPLHYPLPPPPEPLTMLATAYSRSAREGTADGITARGSFVREGIVAVDPRTIPLGTEIFIEDMGLFVAEDTGGNIKNNRLDIYFDCYDEAVSFGVRLVKVWVQHPGIVR